MRQYRFRAVVLVVSVVLALGVFAGPREKERESRGRESPIAKAVKRVRALGDLLTVPVPAPKPAPQP
jgi:hypothetical protein